MVMPRQRRSGEGALTTLPFVKQRTPLTFGHTIQANVLDQFARANWTVVCLIAGELSAPFNRRAAIRANLAPPSRRQVPRCHPPARPAAGAAKRRRRIAHRDRRKKLPPNKPEWAPAICPNRTSEAAGGEWPMSRLLASQSFFDVAKL
jgi:hypothetical protein